LIESLETSKNIKGLFASNTNSEKTLVAYLETKPGFIKIKNYNSSTEISINASKSPPAFFTFNNEGTILATASERVFKINNIY